MDDMRRSSTRKKDRRANRSLLRRTIFLMSVFGILIFVMSKVSGLPAIRLIKAYIPWIAAMIAALLLISFIPQLSLALPIAAHYAVF